MTLITMKHAHAKEILAWLRESPSLSQLSARFPEEWASVQHEVTKIIAQGTPEELRRLTEPPAALPRNAAVPSALVAAHVRHRMACLLVKQYSLSVVTGVSKGKVRFDLVNGLLAQKLFFSNGLERRMTSLFWFRLIWPLIWRKKLLMPLVESRGIYCFYSKELVEGLAALIGRSVCVEIAAGDGTLTRFLSNAGVSIVATDNHSWKHAIRYPESVILCDARQALERYEPEVVICSWPPAGNDFERHVFKKNSVAVYIAIGSRHQFASGNWTDYAAQGGFLCEEDKALSALVLPPELESAVYVFRRKPA